MAVNLTSGPPTRRIVAFTIPLLIGNLFQQLYAFTDAAVVGRLIDVQALAAVGATGGLHFLLIGFTFGASGGLAIPVARAFGAGDMSQMRRYVAAGSLVSVGIAVVITLVGVFGSGLLLRLLNTPAELQARAEIFLVITFSATVVVMAYNFLASVIRALGDSTTPLIFLVVACVLNAGLVVLFIGGFHLGVPGAAWATVVAQMVSVLLCAVLIWRRMPLLHLRRPDWRISRSEFGETARLGVTMGFQLSVIAIGALVLQYAINGLGSDAVAAYTASMRIDQTAAAPLSSFGVAMATYVAQNRGARQWTRIRVGVFRISLVSVAAALVLGTVVIVFGQPLVELFIGPGEPAIAGMAHQYLIINGALYAILALMFVFRSSIQGLGLTGVPTLAGIMELVFRAIAGLWLVSAMGFLGVCLAAPLAWLGALVPLLIAWLGQRRRLSQQQDSDDAVAAELARAELAGAPMDGLVLTGLPDLSDEPGPSRTSDLSVDDCRESPDCHCDALCGVTS